MCEKCRVLDEKIVHYRRFETVGLDPLTAERIKRYIDELQLIREAMHPRGYSIAD
jgi:hypothetical protein